MAIKVGNSYVSEAAYEQAKRNVENEQNTTSKGRLSKNDSLSQLKGRFSKLNITTNTTPFQGKGINNMSISPKILEQMENNPEKRLEYEALLIDCQKVTSSLTSIFQQNGFKLKSFGFILDENGGLSSWSVTEGTGSGKTSTNQVYKEDKKSWYDAILEGLNEHFKDDLLENDKIGRFDFKI